MQVGTGILNVALRKESVDRNEVIKIYKILDFAVALRKESVDRNTYYIGRFSICCLSLSARRAWIEIHLLTT